LHLKHAAPQQRLRRRLLGCDVNQSRSLIKRIHGSSSNSSIDRMKMYSSDVCGRRMNMFADCDPQFDCPIKGQKRLKTATFIYRHSQGNPDQQRFTIIEVRTDWQ